MRQQEHRQIRTDLSGRLTAVIPVRIDSEERRANLRTVVRHILQLGCRITVLEADSKPRLEHEEWQGDVDYVIMKDSNPVFHRTKYINILLNRADTGTVAVWDTDVLVDHEMISKAMALISSGCTLVYPYNGEVVWLDSNLSQSIRRNTDVEYLRQRKLKPLFGRRFCGGLYMVHRLRYLECGGENENFTGWGPEDVERLRRVRILGHEARWVPEGQAYHLWHPRGRNSGFISDGDSIRLRMEMVKVSSMTKKELQDYISGDRWNITRN